jgi:hypothetical protein
MDVIRFQRICDIPVASDGYSLVAKSVANDHSLLFLFVEPAGRHEVTETFKKGIGVFPRARMRTHRRFRLLRVTEGSSHAIELPELDVTFPLVDRFPNGKVLISGPRSSWRSKKDYDLNGIIFDPQTGQSLRILLGDGINSVQIDGLGRIWVSYADEGVYGNFGWGQPGPAPIGAAGLVCFSESGAKLWEYPVEAEDTITDCYALNVSGSVAAVCFYTDFPICRVSRDFKLEYWKTNLRGCHEFAISETKALLSGQYDDPPDRAYLGHLEAGRLGNPHEIRLVLPDGTSIPGGQLFGRGTHLYFFDTSSAYRASVD